MALLLKKGECFLHIPKAGGSWVSVILKEQGLVYKEIGYHKHIDWTRVAFFLNRTLDYYPKLILVLINFFPESFFLLCTASYQMVRIVVEVLLSR